MCSKTGINREDDEEKVNQVSGILFPISLGNSMMYQSFKVWLTPFL
jgi:hypothetical protein